MSLLIYLMHLAEYIKNQKKQQHRIQISVYAK